MTSNKAFFYQKDQSKKRQRKLYHHKSKFFIETVLEPSPFMLLIRNILRIVLYSVQETNARQDQNT